VNTEDLIDLLARDAAVQRTLSSRMMTALAAGAGAALVLFLILLGVRPDILVAATTPRFLFKILFALAILLCSAAAVARVGRPEISLRSFGRLLAALSIALAAAVIAELVVTPPGLWSARLIGQNAVFCLIVIPVLAFAPLVCLLLALREGAPSHPGLAGAVAGLAASGIAMVLYATHCPDDSPLFVAAWYSLATAVVVSAGYAAGTRVLKW
jgi:hypothetical protein